MTTHSFVSLRPERCAWVFTSIVTLAVVLDPASAHAQINTSTLAPGPLSEGFSGTLSGSIMRVDGNSAILDLGIGGQIQVIRLFSDAGTNASQPRTVKQRVSLMGKIQYTAAGPQVIVNQSILYGRFEHMWNPRIGMTVFVQHQFNEFQRLLVRSLWGTRIMLPIVSREAFALHLGTGYMLEYNRILVSPGASDSPETIEHRWSNFLQVKTNTFGGRLLAQNTTYVQPRWDKLGDVRFLDEIELLVKVNQVLGVGATLSVLYDSAPPTGVKTTDTRIASTVTVSF